LESESKSEFASDSDTSQLPLQCDAFQAKSKQNIHTIKMQIVETTMAQPAQIANKNNPSI